jgi:ribosomal protein L11 methyltransferase
MDYREFNIFVKRDAVDLVCASLYDFPIQGVEIGDQYISEEDQKAMFVDALGIDNIQEDEIPVKFYISYEDDVEQIIKAIMDEIRALSERVELGSMRLTTAETSDDDWAHNWKSFYYPFMIGKRILVRPIWEDVTSVDGIIPEFIIDIDPGMAFGSGTHETTSMCVKALDKYVMGKETLIDLGCGSGILGIAAAKLGIEKGILIDLDQSACKIANENIISNQVADKLSVIHGDLLENVSEVVDIVVANIFAEVIIGVTPDVKKLLKVNGLFITSGIITEKEEAVVETLQANGFEIKEIFHDGGWVAIISQHVK